ncbi:amidohydrolase, partial [Candidatus Bathyarchaeota archaeon]
MKMERVDLIIRNAIIIPVSRRIIFKGSIGILGDRIIAVGKDDDIMNRYSAERYI